MPPNAADKFRIECLVTSEAVSESEAEPSHRAIEVAISSAVAETARSGATAAPKEHDNPDEAMGKSKRSRARSQKDEEEST